MMQQLTYILYKNLSNPCNLKIYINIKFKQDHIKVTLTTPCPRDLPPLPWFGVLFFFCTTHVYTYRKGVFHGLFCFQF